MPDYPDDVVERVAVSILRAAGSNFKHYTPQNKTLIMSAARAEIAAINQFNYFGASSVTKNEMPAYFLLPELSLKIVQHLIKNGYAELKESLVFDGKKSVKLNISVGRKMQNDVFPAPAEQVADE